MITPQRTSNSKSKDRVSTKSTTIIAQLIRAYNAEIETVMNYIAASANLDGIRAEEIRESLLADVPAELGHAQRLAKRVRTLGGTVPGSQDLTWEQASLQPPRESTDVVAVIKGVLDAEESAIAMYQNLIDACDGEDYVTQDLVIEILADEQEHRREFAGFLKEYERGNE